VWVHLDPTPSRVPPPPGTRAGAPLPSPGDKLSGEGCDVIFRPKAQGACALVRPSAGRACFAPGRAGDTNHPGPVACSPPGFFGDPADPKTTSPNRSVEKNRAPAPKPFYQCVPETLLEVGGLSFYVLVWCVIALWFWVLSVCACLVRTLRAVRRGAEKAYVRTYVRANVCTYVRRGANRSQSVPAGMCLFLIGSVAPAFCMPLRRWLCVRRRGRSGERKEL